MTKVFAAIVLAVAASVAFGYSGALVSVTDVALSDVPGPQPITVFSPPAAANFGGACLLYDNYANLAFSTGYALADRNWLTFPLTAPNITINPVDYQGQWAAGGFKVTGVLTLTDPNSGLFTNINQAPVDNRFPAHIPRVGRFAGYEYTAVQFVFDDPMKAAGVFIATNSNQWGFPWALDDDNNRMVLQSRKVWVGVLGETDTYATAQYTQVACGSMYAPFIKVLANGNNLIKSICVVQDSSVESDAPFGFFDVYVKIPTDVDADGHVDVIDLLTFAGTWGLSQGEIGYDATCDFNGDNSIDVMDLLTLTNYFGKY